MKSARIVGWTCLIAIVIPTAEASAGESQTVPLDRRIVRGEGAEVVSGRARTAGSSPDLTVTFRPDEWPSAVVLPPTPWDWKRFRLLVVDLKNPGPRPIAFGVRIDDDPGADGIRHCRTAEGTIGPGRSARFAVDFGRGPKDHGMRGLPGFPGAETLVTRGEGPFDPGHVVALRVFLHKPAMPETLVVGGMRLEPVVSLEGIVDRFGQAARGEWPGKVHREEELARRREAEAADLKDHPASLGRDRFGGWRDGPRRHASGFFRAEKLGESWWLVDPDGALFFSTGIDVVADEAATFVTGRESMFAWLPGAADPLAGHFGRSGNVHSGPVKEGRTFDFYAANLERKYGPDFKEAWRAMALARLRSWGFNTIGNWSDWRFYRNGRLPYVATVHVGGDHARVSSGSDYWGRMHDPFDPRFALEIERSLRDVANAVKGDPWCLGYFVDNELSWGGSPEGGEEGRYGLALGTLGADGDAPAKRAFREQLRRRYGEVAGLNAAWGTTFRDWEALSAPWKPAVPPGAAMKADLAAFVKEFARHYFRTVRDQLKRVDPDHLYLGCRFAWRTPEAVEAAAESCDVVSFNIYARRVEPERWAFLSKLGRPAIIGEFHSGALDRGMFHAGLVASPDQKGRAALYREYVGSVVDHPALVGCHWFQYVDEPLTGRTFDGENYNVGFVDVTDTPYPELVEAARTVHGAAYPRRFARSSPASTPR